MAKKSVPGAAHDGLAQPISFSAKYGKGADRGLVLGGGGVFFVAWQVAYLQGLAKRGVDVSAADKLIGTSAGSVVASIIAAKKLKAFSRKINMLAKVPSAIGAMAPAAGLRDSQTRALDMFRFAQDANNRTVRDIGFAALAAGAAPAAGMRRNIGIMLSSSKWPAHKLNISATDVYSGERLVISSKASVSAARASAASSAVPGLFEPQPVLDRRCMDGGVSGSGTHCDVVSGAKRVLVVSLGANMPMDQPAMTIAPNNLQYELARLDEMGTYALLRGPRKVDMDKLMSPDAVPEAIAMGDEQAEEDVKALKKFWN